MSKPERQAELDELRTRLSEAEETLNAIRRGEVDAVVVSAPQGERIYTLQGADFPNGLVGVLQGLLLFCVLGGELFIRYRVRIERRHRTATETA